MGSFSEKVTILIETKTASAKQQFADLKHSVGEADGAFGKLKAGASGLTDMVGGLVTSMGPAGFAAAGAAAVGVALKAVGQFQDLGVKIGLVKDQTGLSAEETSRWVEVADDAGISAETFAGLVGKLEKNLGTNKDALAAWGVQVKTNADGSVDMNATLLNTIDVLNKTTDPIERNKLGNAAFGKSWAGVAELINRGAPQLRADLESVQPSKIYSDKDVDAARKVRDGYDAMRDAGEGLMLTLGRSLAPAVARIATALSNFISAAEPGLEALGDAAGDAVEQLAPLVELAGQLAGTLGKLGNIEIGDKKLSFLTAGLLQLKDAAGVTDDEFRNLITGPLVTFLDQSVELTGNAEGLKLKLDDTSASTATFAAAAIHADDKLAELNRTTETAEDRQKDVDAAARGVTRALDGQNAAWARLKGEISDEQAWLDMEGTFADVKAKGSEAMEAVKNKSADADQKMRDYQASVLDAKSKVIDLGQQLGLSIPQVKGMLLQIDDGDIDVVEGRLRTLTRNRTISLDIQSKGGAGFDTGVKRATGGNTGPNEINTIINEDGQEVANLPGGTQVVPAAQSRRLLNGGGTTNNNYYTINVGPGQNARDIEALGRLWSRRNGAAGGWGLRAA